MAGRIGTNSLFLGRGGPDSAGTLSTAPGLRPCASGSVPAAAVALYTILAMRAGPGMAEIGGREERKRD